MGLLPVALAMPAILSILRAGIMDEYGKCSYKIHQIGGWHLQFSHPS